MAGSVTLIVLLILLVRSAGLPFVSRPVGTAERVRIATRCRLAIERAGGSEVWVKVPPHTPFPSPQVNTAVEVAIAHSRFDAVLAAFEEQAVRERVQVEVEFSRARGQWRSARIGLVRGRRPAGRWLLREVPRMRHAAIIIDDLGHDLGAAQRWISLPYPVTFAVLPHLAHSATTAEEAHQAGREVMLHLPMEADSAAQPGAGEIRVGMRKSEVEHWLDADLGSVPYARGVNNHMGSRATTDANLMAEVMDALAQRGLFFIDSRTSAASVALDVARRRGIPTFYRSVFLDDVETVPYTLGQLRELLRIIEEQDAALAIGHPYPTTLAALERFLPEFERRDIQLVQVSQLLRLPVVAERAPAPPGGD